LLPIVLADKFGCRSTSRWNGSLCQARSKYTYTTGWPTFWSNLRSHAWRRLASITLPCLPIWPIRPVTDGKWRPALNHSDHIGDIDKQLICI